MAFVRRAGATFMIVVATSGLAACVGGTDPATNVRATQARLHAHGHTNDGPAEWWWEYSSSRPTLESGGGTKVCGTEPDGRCGPASSAAEVRLSTVVSGLTPDTTYHFRACGQDTNDANPSCNGILSFRTTKANSTAAVSGGVLTFTAPATASPTNAFVSRRFTDSDGVIKYQLEDLVSEDRAAGTSIVPGAGCSSIPGRPIDDAVRCPVAGITRIRALLNDGNDLATTDDSVTVPSTLDGGAGQDRLRGGDGADDLLITGPGGNLAFGGEERLPFDGGGNDTFETRNGAHDQIACGNGFDTANIGLSDVVIDEAFGAPPCEQTNRAPE
jgi:Ca2+-binding RTX toxin-like protein